MLIQYIIDLRNSVGLTKHEKWHWFENRCKSSSLMIQKSH